MIAAEFLDSRLGRIFCLQARQAQGLARGRAVVLPPFGEELNKSRHVLSALVRHLDAHSFDVVLPDLYGTGDSEGDFADADLNTWRADIEAAVASLPTGPRLHLIALRAGALLAVDAAARHPVDSLTLIHPVADGRQLLNQLLRLRLAGGLLGGGQQETAAELRQRLSAGETLEIAGYAISAALAGGIESLNLGTPDCATARRVNWIELVAEQGRALMPTSQRVVEAWQAAGVEVTTDTLVCDSFWATQEIAYCQDLVDRVCNMPGL